MLKFRRTIAIFVLTLFTCQAVMAGIDEHSVFQSDGSAADTSHHAAMDHTADSTTDHGQSGTPEMVDGDCCHAQGHCHLLAFAGQVANISMPHGLSLTTSHTCSYHSLSFDTLLRPPASA
jgi:hypothetical protein